MPEILGPSFTSKGGDPLLDTVNAVNNLIEEVARQYPDETKKAVTWAEKKGFEKTAITVTAMQALGKLKGLFFGTFIVEGFISPGEPEQQFRVRPLTFDERLAIYRAEMGPRIIVSEQWRADP